MATTMINIMTSAVIPPARLVRSEAVRRSIGILSKVTLVRTPTQKGARYHTAASIGAVENVGRVKRKARRQKAYATNKVGRKVPKAWSMGGGFALVWEKSVMCQNPMHTRLQNVIIGLGRRARNRRHVTSMLKASPGVRMSVQCVREVDRSNCIDSGKTEGKPMDVRPFAVVGKKLVKLPTSCNDAQPPLESVIIPLSSRLVTTRGGMNRQCSRLCRRGAYEAISAICFVLVASSNNERDKVYLFASNCAWILQNHRVALCWTPEVKC